MMAGDWNTYGRVYVAGNGRGVLYTNCPDRALGMRQFRRAVSTGTTMPVSVSSGPFSSAANYVLAQGADGMKVTMTRP